MVQDWGVLFVSVDFPAILIQGYLTSAKKISMVLCYSLEYSSWENSAELQDFFAASQCNLAYNLTYQQWFGEHPATIKPKNGHVV